MFFRKKKVIVVNGKEIELEPKPLFKKAPQVNTQQNTSKKTEAAQAQNTEQNKDNMQINNQAVKEGQEEKKIKVKKSFFNRKKELIEVKPIQTPHIEIPQAPVSKPVENVEAKAVEAKRKKETFLDKYALQVVGKQKGLIDALREQQITPTEFVKRSLTSAIMMGILVAVIFIILLPSFGIPGLEAYALAFITGFAIAMLMYKNSIRAPLRKKIEVSKHAEKDILFAAREIIISLRSGMPLYNAIVAVSQGYGDASVGFRKIVENVQLGMPLEDAIDEAIANSKSTSFRRLMIQASLSIRIGSDVIAALQAVISQLSEERIIELRAYGQRLNALTMFYMLFGVILPSMGIAVATILTTFIPIITINVTMLALALVFILFLQIMFLQLVKSGRPTFSM